MKTYTKCPRCHSEHVILPGKSIDLLFALGMSIIGLGLLVPALSQSIACYFFTFILCITGSIGTYKGINDNLPIAHCKDCKNNFEHLLE